jgi:hypothetical protein
MKIYDDEDGKRTLKEEKDISYLPGPRTLHEVQLVLYENGMAKFPLYRSTTP